MTPEERIRMLMEENAALRAQLQGRSPPGSYAGVPNPHGITPEMYQADMAEADALRQWQDQQSYMGGGMSDLMHRTPPRPSQHMRKEDSRKSPPSPHLRPSARKPKKGGPVGLD
jgi:hypothetical protein